MRPEPLLSLLLMSSDVALLRLWWWSRCRCWAAVTLVQVMNLRISILKFSSSNSKFQLSFKTACHFEKHVHRPCSSLYKLSSLLVIKLQHFFLTALANGYDTQRQTSIIVLLAWRSALQLLVFIRNPAHLLSGFVGASLLYKLWKNRKWVRLNHYLLCMLYYQTWP